MNIDKKVEEKVIAEEKKQVEAKAADPVKDSLENSKADTGYAPSMQPYLEALRLINAKAIGDNLSFSMSQSAEQLNNNSKDVAKVQEETGVEEGKEKVSDSPALTSSKEIICKAIEDAQALSDSNSKLTILSGSNLVTSAPTIVTNATSTMGIVSPSYHLNSSCLTQTANYFATSSEMHNTRTKSKIDISDTNFINTRYRSTIAQVDETKGQVSGNYFTKEVKTISARVQNEGGVSYNNFENKENVTAKKVINRIGESSLTVIGTPNPSAEVLDKINFLNIASKLAGPAIANFTGVGAAFTAYNTFNSIKDGISTARNLASGLGQNSLFNFSIPQGLQNTVVLMEEGKIRQFTGDLSTQVQTSNTQAERVQQIASVINDVAFDQVMVASNDKAVMVGNNMAAIGNNRGNGFTMVGKKVLLGGLYNIIPAANTVKSLAYNFPGIKIPDIPSVPPKSNPFSSKDIESCIPDRRKRQLEKDVLNRDIPIIKTPDFNPYEDGEIGVADVVIAQPPSKTQEDLELEASATLAKDTGITSPVVSNTRSPGNIGVGEGLESTLGNKNVNKPEEENNPANTGAAKATTIMVNSISGTYPELFQDALQKSETAQSGTEPPLCFGETCLVDPSKITKTLLDELGADISKEVMDNITSAIKSKIESGDPVNIKEIVSGLALEASISTKIEEAFNVFDKIAVGPVVPESAVTDSPAKNTPTIIEQGKTYLGTFRSYLENTPIVKDLELTKDLLGITNDVSNILNNNLIKLTYEALSEGPIYNTQGGILDGFSSEVREEVLTRVLNLSDGLLPEEISEIKNVVEYYAGYLLVGGSVDEDIIISQIENILNDLNIGENAISIFQSAANLALDISNGEIINILSNDNISNIVNKLGLDDEIAKISSVVATASKVIDTISTLSSLPALFSSIEGGGIESLLQLANIVQCTGLISQISQTIKALENPFKYRSANQQDIERILAIFKENGVEYNSSLIDILSESAPVSELRIPATPIYVAGSEVTETNDLTNFSKALLSNRTQIVTIFYSDTTYNIQQSSYLIIGKTSEDTEIIQIVGADNKIEIEIPIANIDSVNLNNGLSINKNN